MTKYGLKAAIDQHDIKDRQLKYDSGNGHLSVDLGANPFHFDTVPIIGNALTIDSTPRYETIFKIPHGKPFVPKVDCYFYLDADADAATIISNNLNQSAFYNNFLPLLALGAPYIDAYIYSVNDTYFEIGHHTMHYLGGSLTSSAPNLPALCKYYIYNVKGYERIGQLDPLL